MVLHLNVALNEPGSGIVHPDYTGTSRRDAWPMVLHLLPNLGCYTWNVALNEPGSGIVHQDGTTGQWCYT